MAWRLLTATIFGGSLAQGQVSGRIDNDVSDVTTPIHQRHGFLPSWSNTAIDLAEFLGQPSQDGASFLTELASKRKLTDMFDSMYVLHPRLRFFLIFELLVLFAMLGIGIPCTCVACRGGGHIPLFKRGYLPDHCVAYCLTIGILMAMVLADLVVMLGSHVGMSDAMRRLPDSYRDSIGGLRVYFNQTVVELFAELEDSDKSVAQDVRRFLNTVLPDETLKRLLSESCKTTGDSFTFKLNECSHPVHFQEMPGAPVEDQKLLIWENLQFQLNQTLRSLENMEFKLNRFEARTGLWTNMTMVGLVAVPLIMVLLCLTVAFTGFGIGFGIRNYINWFGETIISLRYTGILLFSSAALMMMYYAFATPLLMTMVTAGVLGECYVCKPYRTKSFKSFQDIATTAWPSEKRPLLFARLTPEFLLAKCAGEGVSIAALNMMNPRATTISDGSFTEGRGFPTERGNMIPNATAGNCRRVHTALKHSMNLFCNEYLENHHAISLSLGVSLLLLLFILPMVVAVSQSFIINEDENDSSGQYDQQTHKSENSQEELMSSTDTGSDLQRNKRMFPFWLSRKRKDSNRMTFLSDPWKHCLDEIYRQEGVNIYDVVSVMSESDSPGEKKRGSSKAKKDTRHIQERPLLSESVPSNVIINPVSPPRRSINAVLVDEAFPRLPLMPKQKSVKFRPGIQKKTSRKTPLGTIPEEESESAESADTSAFSSSKDNDYESPNERSTPLWAECPIHGDDEMKLPAHTTVSYEASQPLVIKKPGVHVFYPLAPCCDMAEMAYTDARVVFK